jgi:hypothetical protein
MVYYVTSSSPQKPDGMGSGEDLAVETCLSIQYNALMK